MLNMFDEFCMTDPGPPAFYAGFTETEEPPIYIPRSVVRCIRFGKIGNDWNQTEAFDALRIYMDMDFDGL